MNYKELSDVLLDILCDLQSCYYAARVLVEAGYDYDDLVELKFDQELIERVMNDDMHNRDYE